MPAPGSFVHQDAHSSEHAQIQVAAVNEVLAGASVAGTMEIRDNWYVVRAVADKRLLMVGPFLPVAQTGVYTEMVDPTFVPFALDELRARLNAPPVVLILRSEGS